MAENGFNLELVELTVNVVASDEHGDGRLQFEYSEQLGVRVIAGKKRKTGNAHAVEPTFKRVRPPRR